MEKVKVDYWRARIKEKKKSVLEVIKEINRHLKYIESSEYYMLVKKNYNELPPNTIMIERKTNNAKRT